MNVVKYYGRGCSHRRRPVGTVGLRAKEGKKWLNVSLIYLSLREQIMRL